MNSKLLFCFTLVLSGSLFGGCVSAHRPAVTVVTETDHYISIHMLDTRNGWAQADGPEGFRVLRTTDGARTWKDVTPCPFSYDAWECEFAKAQTAWISIHDRKTGSAGLLLTTNGGKSWAQVPAPFGYFTEASHCRFFNGHFGIARVGDFGAGNAYYNFCETQDGGMTWKSVDVIPRHPDPSPSISSGTFHLCNLCGDDVVYYPPGKFIITCGDSGDEKPNGCVRLSVSADSGKSWRDLQLPLPDEWRDGQTTPLPPVFFGTRNGLLPVQVFKQDDNSRTYVALLFYRTSDSGNTWAPGHPTLELRSGLTKNDFDIISLNDIVVRSGGNLNVTHDGARTWQTVKPNIDFGLEGSRRDVTQMDFVDVMHGWIIISDNSKFSRYGNFSLYKTSNGGKTWMELPLIISQRSASP